MMGVACLSARRQRRRLGDGRRRCFAASISCNRAADLYISSVSLVWFGLLSMLVIERRASCPPRPED
jgi:hypothetical protein